MRKNRSFRPFVAQPLEDRVVPSSAAISPTVIYKAQLANNLSATFDDFVSKTGFGPNPNYGYFGLPNPLAINSVITGTPPDLMTQYDPNAIATYRSTVSADLAGLWSEVRTMLAPLPRSKELIATIRNEMVGSQPSSMASIISSSLDQIQSILLSSPSISAATGANATVVSEQQYHQFNEVQQAILAQVKLFETSRVSPGHRASNPRAARVNAQVDQAFSTFTAGVNALPGLQPGGDSSLLGPDLLAKINTFNSSLNSIYAANKIKGNLLGALQSQVYNYSKGSMLQELTDILGPVKLSFNVRQQVNGLIAATKLGVNSTITTFVS